jgi:thymidylate synthase
MWIRDAKTMTNNRYYRIRFVRCFIIRNLALQRSQQHITALARALIREGWNLNRRTAQEYVTVAFSMLRDNEETSKIRNLTNTRRKRIRHLYMKLLWDQDIQANPWKLIQYAMKLWGVRRRSAWEYEQAAWTAFNRRDEDFLEAPASKLKTTYHTIYLSDLAQNNPTLAREPAKLAKIAMNVWGVQQRTADRLTRRVRIIPTEVSL